MKVYKTGQIRNIVLLGNSGSGKTTLAEAMLLEGGVINRKGEVTAKNTVSDFNTIEQEYGNSVFSSVLYAEFLDKKLNILDSPGMDVCASYPSYTGCLAPELNEGARPRSEPLSGR